MNTPLTHWLTWALLFSAAVFPRQAQANVKLPALFSDHIVIQRDLSIPIWGWAAPGESVAVSFAGQKKSVVADANGKWSLRLGKLRANPNAQTLVVAGRNTIAIADVLVGEVWLCSGQSNMTYRLGYNRDYHKAEIAAASDPGLRCFTVDFHTALKPDDDLQPSPWQKWEPANPGSVEHSFPAVGYFFGRELRRQFGPGVPIGLIHSSYPASPIESWVSREALSKDAALNGMADKQIANMVGYPDALKAFIQDVATWEERYSAKDVANTGEAQGWARPGFDDTAWQTISIPMRFAQIGMKAGGGLIARGGVPLRQFATAGEDRKFVWADARIDGDTIVVRSPQVEHPVAVRYAWADNPEGCNLVNGAGLPASPFRTDTWPGITINNH